MQKSAKNDKKRRKIEKKHAKTTNFFKRNFVRASVCENEKNRRKRWFFAHFFTKNGQKKPDLAQIYKKQRDEQAALKQAKKRFQHEETGPIKKIFRNLRKFRKNFFNFFFFFLKLIKKK